MNDFKKKLKLRMLVGFAFALVMTVVNLVVWTLKPEGFNGGFVMGIYSGIALVVLVVAVQAWRALKDEKKIKSLYIEETDERNLALARKSSRLTVLFILLGNIVIGSILMFFYPLVAYSIIGVSVEASILLLLSYLYFSKVL